MASSVARMPSDEWRHHHPSRIAGPTVLGAHAKPLPKVFTRIPTSIDPGPAAAAATATVGEPCSPMTAARRRQSQILDHWAARQARQMITTIERQAHEAELSALSTITQPVSARAASFSDCSSAASSAATVVAPDIPPNVRASSLIQMWRELEAESGLCPTPRATAGPSGSSNSTQAISSAEEPSGGSDACDEADSEVFGEWDSAEHAASSSSASSSTAESEISERRRVGEIVRMLSLKMSSSAASSSDEAESAAVPSKVADSSPRPTPPPSPGPTRSTTTAVGAGGKTLPVKESSEMEGLVEKLEQERRREVAALAERHPVSRFPFRGRIQSLIRLRSLRREVATIRHQQRSRKLEAERCQTQSNIFGCQRDLDEFQTDESSSSSRVHDSGCANTVGISDDEDNHYQQLITTRHLESSPQSFYSPQAFFTPISRHEDLKESRSPDASWDERTLWGSSFDWQRPSDSPALQTFHGEVAAEGTKTLGQVQAATPTECKWLSERASSRCGWEATKQTSYHDSLSTISMDNGEIRELLERKTVSTSLSSDFSIKMNQMIMSFLNRKEQQCTDESCEEQCDEQNICRLNSACSSHQGAAASSVIPLSVELLQLQQSWQSTSLPLSSQMLQQMERWRNSSSLVPSQEPQRHESPLSTSFPQNLSPNSQEGEVIHGLKNNIGQIHHEISELRKMIESCLEWQTKLEHLIKQEVSSAVTQLSGRGKPFHNSKWIPGRKDTCCICCEEQVDSLLYRCGHMCACYKCAQELHWSSGRCPICRSMIVDVVRVFQNC